MSDQCDKPKTQFSKTHWNAGKLRILWYWARFSRILCFFRLPKHKTLNFRVYFPVTFPFLAFSGQPSIWIITNGSSTKNRNQKKKKKKKRSDDIWGKYWIEKIVPLTTILGFPDSPSFLLRSSCRWKILSFFRWKKKRVWSFSLIVRRSLHFYVIVSFPLQFFTEEFAKRTFFFV